MIIAAARSPAICGVLQLHLKIVRVLEIQLFHAVAIADSGFDAVFFEQCAGAWRATMISLHPSQCHAGIR